MNNNAVLIQTPTNYLKLWAFDTGIGSLEFYKRDPYLYADLPVIIVKDNKAVFWYTSKRPRVQEYRLKLLADALSEEGRTQYHKGIIITTFQARRIK